jgi:hypothetical protein
VTLATTSALGAFSVSPSGPWTPTLTLTIPAGTSTASFYYQDTVAGTPTLSALLLGQPPATQTVTVVAGAPATIAISPRDARVVGGRTQTFAATVADAYGNPSSEPVTWTLGSAVFGTLNPTTGPSTTFTATPTVAGRTRIRATVGTLQATSALTVVRPPVTLGGVLTRRIRGQLVVTVWFVRGSVRARGVRVTLVVRRGSSIVAHVSGRTDARGRLVWRSRHQLPPAHYTVRAAVRTSSTS